MSPMLVGADSVNNKIQELIIIKATNIACVRSVFKAILSIAAVAATTH